MIDTKQLIEQLEQTQTLSKEDMLYLIKNRDEDTRAYLKERAVAVRKRVYGTDVYIRGLIEVSNVCKNNCYYCGIRKDNTNVTRYRLNKDDIMKCCEMGYELGFRTFVMQGGEDGFFTDDVLEDIIKTIRKQYPECAITLSLGERDRRSYQRLFDAGANRYLLRHETADEVHYQKLHPKHMSLRHRKQCLYDLKEIGYQVGCGIMVGSPFQTVEHLVKDLVFMKELSPHMVGIGPFLPQKDTPFGKEASGTLELTLYLLCMIRLLLPHVLLPATTALGTVHSSGREQGILSGANVVMPNLSPVAVRKNYTLYDHKICMNEEAAEGIKSLKCSMQSIGYQVVVHRGDCFL